MQVTEVRIKLAPGSVGNDRIRAFASIVLDGTICIRDLKVISGNSGLLIAMPSRKLTDKCGQCGTKNHCRARFCSHCGCRLDENRALRDSEGRTKLHADVAHPICYEGRAMIQQAVIDAYAAELELSKRPGYVSRYDDYGDDHDDLAATGPSRAPAPLAAWVA